MLTYISAGETLPFRVHPMMTCVELPGLHHREQDERLTSSHASVFDERLVRIGRFEG